ncbi:hypothetical protein J2751_000139 [Halorubrum alkaliphilum]|uniref:Uncharacterized protein n=1 Tax=Halorubrum alkaliphilum TaxID=261290 RepID=A0A8T4GAP1_9EURY|nr:DUF5787 family protein [Halorubrum alkaliphilum]MBP1921156.1 hypothetical protein [Halorubrum alkaliphilum]
MILDAEFGYELLVCRYAELAWHPDGEPRPAIVSRQLGTRDRRWDTVVIEVDPGGFAARRRFGDRTIDSDLLHVVRHAPADWAWYRDALPDPGYPWRYVRQAAHRAAGRDLIETRRRGNRIEIRRIRPYPDWVRRIVAIENKPDLDRSAADALADQLAHDVDIALADEVWLATESTGGRVEPALLRSLPVEAGILTTRFGETEREFAACNERATVDGDTTTVDADAATVDWFPSDLAPNGPSGRDPETVTRRLEIAERAYGKGWRSYHDTMRPDCRYFELQRAGRGLVPYCSAKDRCPTNRECAGSCSSFAPEPPAWRTKGWPIEGGPGKGIRALLNRRRERVRDRFETEND